MPPDATQSRHMPGSVAVFGGGTVACLTTVALARALPRTRVTLVTPPGGSCNPTALADLAHTTWPGLARLHERIGIAEDDILRRASGSHCLGLRYANWRTDGAEWIIGHGAASPSGPGIAAALARAGRFALPDGQPGSPLAGLDYTLRFDPRAYRAGLRSIANRLGTTMAEGRPAAASHNETGAITQVILDTGAQIAADLFIDATGPGAGLIALAGQPQWIDWQDHLPVNRLLPAKDLARPGLSMLDRFEACREGWLWTSPGRDGTRTGLAYNASLTSDAEAADALLGHTGASPGEVIAITPGRLEKAFTGNVIALGDAAAQFEPIGWCNLHLAVRAIELLLEILPGLPIDTLEQYEFNRRWALLADRTRDFLAAHYTARPAFAAPFWQAAARLKHSPELILTLREFARRSRLPVFEEESLSRDAWLQLLAGNGTPAGMAPRKLAMGHAAREKERADEDRRVAAALHAAAPYPNWLANRLGAPSS
ncbi:tryptophan 7-halogenase [Novosphingobium beihaiensis]|uniref:Tryptophan 7-halogenase n=1 Tax=Novosphingobium beihaiensis TaxID=2930389 RepID=A0ABT0BSC2_9SPHN|nr:tryptophan 7-halogenase [Novosphingobium beihaiensis]MCJ2187681.1 tryptophan 7-halogenase [Novosphingobium beihaiensis]